MAASLDMQFGDALYEVVRQRLQLGSRLTEEELDRCLKILRGVVQLGGSVPVSSDLGEEWEVIPDPEPTEPIPCIPPPPPEPESQLEEVQPAPRRREKRLCYFCGWGFCNCKQPPPAKSQA